MSADPEHSIAICIAAFNRRETTLRCLERLYEIDRPDGLGITIYLLDDASTDGTADAVRAAFPEVNLFTGDGSLFWAGGMRIAFGAALKHAHPYYIWMNDDVVARQDALIHLVETERRLCVAEKRHHLVTGGMWDPEMNVASYGGYKLLSRFNPSQIEQVLPEPDRAVPIDLPNANMLLIPAEIAHELGNIPDWYTHTLGDWDYGLRALRHGYGTSLAPGYVGECAANVAWRRRWHAAGLSLRERYRRMLGPLALPFKPRAFFLMAHFRWSAPFLMFAPYLKLPVDHWFNLSRQDRP